MSTHGRFVLTLLTAICLPGLALAVEPLSNKSLSNAYISGSPPNVATCKPDGSVPVGRIADKRQASPCPLLINAEERQLNTAQDPASLANRALVDSTRVITPPTTITQPLLDNPNQPSAGALETQGSNVTLFVPASTSTPQSSSGSNLNINSGPGGTVVNIHVPTR